MRMKRVKVAWAGNTKAKWKENLKRLQTLKRLMKATKRMNLKKFLRHCLEISKYKVKVKSMIKSIDKIDNLSTIDKVKANLDRFMVKKMLLLLRKKILKKNSLILKKIIKLINRSKKNLKIMKEKIVLILITDSNRLKGKIQEQVQMVEKEEILIEIQNKMISRKTFSKLKINQDLEQILFQSLFLVIVAIISRLLLKKLETSIQKDRLTLKIMHKKYYKTLKKQSS